MATSAKKYTCTIIISTSRGSYREYRTFCTIVSFFAFIFYFTRLEISILETQIQTFRSILELNTPFSQYWNKSSYGYAQCKTVRKLFTFFLPLIWFSQNVWFRLLVSRMWFPISSIFKNFNLSVSYGHHVQMKTPYLIYELWMVHVVDVITSCHSSSSSALLLHVDARRIQRVTTSNSPISWRAIANIRATVAN